MSDAGTTVSRAELARIMGVDPKTVDRWVARGCPNHKTARRREFNTRAVIEWRIERAAVTSDDEVLDFEAARARKVTAEASLAEADLEQRRGELVEIDTIAELVETALTTVRLRLLAVPQKLAPRVAVTKSVATVRRQLEDEFHQVLEELSTGADFSARATELETERRAKRK